MGGRKSNQSSGKICPYGLSQRDETEVRFSKEFQQQNLAKIIERLQLRYRQNDSKMTEIGEKITPMADAPNPEKAKLWQEYHLIEDEQISIEKLISKLKDWVK